MDAWMTSKLKVAFIHKLRGLSMRLAYFVACYTRVLVQPGTGTGRLVQELNVCIVFQLMIIFDI